MLELPTTCYLEFHEALTGKLALSKYQDSTNYSSGGPLPNLYKLATLTSYVETSGSIVAAILSQS
jgi:hypothetical protein